MTDEYKRNISELEANAINWWPEDLVKEIAKSSPILLLIDTQEKFISILNLCEQDPQHIFEIAEVSKFPANMLLKHLVVLADYGGEKIQRLNKDFASVFECDGGVSPYMDIVFQEEQFRYTFEGLPVKGALNNKKLFIDGDALGSPTPLTPIMKDMAMILMHGASAINTAGGDLDRCDIGSYMGDSDRLDDYVKQKYIWVSRITGGATANSQGQFAQTYILDHLQNTLGGEYNISRNGSLPLEGYDKKAGMPFDILVSKNGKSVGIEVSFQVTTNSTIERKAGQAADRQRLMHNNGHYIAYVMDGVGNFQRRSAISTICAHSDCTVAYTDSEFDLLAEFIRKVLG